jgi:hypothetical protein
MIAVCVTSRGLIFAITVQSIIEGMQELNKIGIGTVFVGTRDLPIPESQNYCTETALQNKAVDRLLFIEEDMYVDPEAFVALATADAPIATLQYNDKNGSPHGIIHYNEAGEILWCGIGATMIKREVFEALGVPYFTTENRYKIKKKQLKDGKLITDYELIEPHDIWDEEQKKFVKKSEPYHYGGQDVDFMTRARQAGFKITRLEEFKAHHFKLLSLGAEHTNNGCHTITQV